MNCWALTLGLLALLAVSQAEWTIVADNIATIAIGVGAPEHNIVYAAGGDNGVGSLIFKSTDGGMTWNTQPHDPQLMYLSLDAGTATTGIAGALCMFGFTATGSCTTDGNTWVGTDSSLFVSASQSVTAFDNSTFFLVGFFQLDWSSGYFDGVSSSFDGGKTFQYVDWQQGIPTRYGAFPSRTTWFITGGSWPTAENRNKYLRPSAFSERVSVRFERGSKIGFDVKLRTSDPAPRDKHIAGYEGLIARTTDGGRTWTRVFYDAGRFYFNGIDCFDELQCWAVAEGDAGAYIFHTSDGGETWTEQLFTEGAGLFQVEFASRVEGWAVGAILGRQTYSALFLYTSDGGLTWRNINSIPNAYPNDISIVSANEAYATAFLRNGLSSILAYKA